MSSRKHSYHWRSTEFGFFEAQDKTTPGAFVRMMSGIILIMRADHQFGGHFLLEEPCANAGSMRRLSSPSVVSPPTLLAANRLFRVRRVSRVARTVRRRDDGFVLEAHW